MKRSIWGLTLLLALFYVWWQTPSKQPDVTIIGPIQMSEGLGRQSVELIEAVKDELFITCIPTNSPPFKKISKAIKRRLRTPQDPMGKLVLFEECLWTPGHAHYEIFKTPKCEEQLRIAYTMFESTEIPSEWVDAFNTYFDAAIVPDPFLIPIYEACGVEIPLFVLPLGLDLSPFLDAPLKSAPHSPFTFGNLTACIGRKNLTRLVEAFSLAFGNNPEVKLLINSRYSHPDTRAELEERIAELGLENVTFTQKCLSADNYLKKFQEIDCYVSLSRGEGFSIQPREAMAIGIPVVVTDNTAQSTIAQSLCVARVPSGILRPSLNTFGTILETPIQYGYEFDCSVEEAAAALREIQSNYASYLDLAPASREWAAQYDYKHLSSLYLNLLHPQTLSLGEKNEITDRGITTCSSELLAKWKRLFPHIRDS